MFLNRISRQKPIHPCSSSSFFLRHLATIICRNPKNPKNPYTKPRNPNINPRNPKYNPDNIRHSNLHSKYTFNPPPSFTPPNPNNPRNPNNPNPSHEKPKKPRYRPPSSLYERPPLRSTLPFDFRFSYTEPTNSRPIGLREPRYSPFGPGRVAREWTGVIAPIKPPRLTSVDGDENGDRGECVSAVELVTEEDRGLVEERKRLRDRIQGETLSESEKKLLVDIYIRGTTKRQINLGRDGLTHNMLDEIRNHWKHAEAVRIKCMGLPTINMDNVCTQLEDKTFGQIVYRHSGLLVLYRGRNYRPEKRPMIPLMIWKPSAPVYPKAIKTTIEGLSIEETKEIRKMGLAVPAMTKLGRNKYYGKLVGMVRDAFLVAPLIRIDCTGLDKSDHRKIGVHLRDLVPCTLVTFMKEQIVLWNGEDYKPRVDTVKEKEEPPEPPKTIDDLVWD